MKKITMKEFLRTFTPEMHRTESAVSLQRLALESFCRLMVKRKYRASYVVCASRATAEGDINILTQHVSVEHRSKKYQQYLLEAQNCLHVIKMLQARLEIRKQELLSMVEEN